MSRNFELLERVQQDRELFRIPSVTRTDPGSSRPADGKTSLPDLDALTHEEVLRLVQCLFLATEGNGCNGPRRVVFCGIDEVVGSNLLCARVGRSLAEQVQSQVCVVDANVRAPSLHRLLDVERTADQSRLQAGAQAQPLQQIASNLWLISGHPAATNGGVTASLDQVRSQIKELPPEFAHVVINAPPVGMYSDAALLGQKADGVVLVLEANSTRRVAACKAKQALEAGNVRVLGAVLNNRTFPIPERIYRLL